MTGERAVHVGRRALVRHLERRVAVVAAGRTDQVLAARHRVIRPGRHGFIGACERRGEHDYEERKQLQGFHRDLLKQARYLFKPWIQRLSSATASASTAEDPSGGICCNGSREFMRSASTLASWWPGAMRSSAAGASGERNWLCTPTIELSTAFDAEGAATRCASVMSSTASGPSLLWQ